MQKHISIHMSGRLGNQLFQWAFAHQVAKKYGRKVQLIYDSIHEHRGYESNLSSLEFSCSHVLHGRRNETAGYFLSGLDKITAKSKKLGSLISSKLRILRAGDHDEILVLPAVAPNLITGFFINWKTVEGIENLLADELKNALEKIDLPVKIENRYQVLHVRRGDFTNLKESFGVLTSEYYVNHLDKLLPAFICTDDEFLVPEIKSATKAISVFGPSELNPIQTLKVMSQASLVVMSNSTLSWWGGFLCEKQGGKVLLPTPFYKYLDDYATTLQKPGFIPVRSIFEN